MEFISFMLLSLIPIGLFWIWYYEEFIIGFRVIISCVLVFLFIGVIANKKEEPLPEPQIPETVETIERVEEVVEPVIIEEPKLVEETMEEVEVYQEPEVVIEEVEEHVEPEVIEEVGFVQEGASQTANDFQNCQELLKVHPAGVPKGHPDYQAKMDRDDDDYACEQ